jgi:hypothetical protein
MPVKLRRNHYQRFQMEVGIRERAALGTTKTFAIKAASTVETDRTDRIKVSINVAQ